MSEEPKIKFYGTTWCPACRRAQKIIENMGVCYEWINIDEDKEARAYVEKVNRGFRSVPTIVFPDGDILVEPPNATLEEKLGKQASTGQ